MELELKRQRRNLELIASENIVSPAVMAAMGTVLTNKYAEGYPGHRYYGGCADVDIVENIARERACRLFGAEHANATTLGAQANLAVKSFLRRFSAWRDNRASLRGENLQRAAIRPTVLPLPCPAPTIISGYGARTCRAPHDYDVWRSRRANLNRSSSSPA